MPDTPPNLGRRVGIGAATSVLLLALLSTIALRLPTNQPQGGYSTAGAWISEHAGWLRGSPSSLQPVRRTSQVDLYYIKEPAGLRATDPDDESWDEVSRLLRERPGDVLHIHYLPLIRCGGFWAMTNQVDHHRLDLEFGSSFTPEERAEAQRRFLAFAAPSLPWVPDEVFSALSRGEVINRSRILYPGYAVNVLTLLLAGAFVLSLRWTLLVPALVRRLRARHALACGRCPTCGYALTSLTTSICPECGRPFTLPSPGPEPQSDGTLPSLGARP